MSVTNKRPAGILFLILAAILGLAAVIQIKAIIGAFTGFFKVFSGSLGAGEAGQATGHLFFWLLYIWALYALVKYGRKWAGSGAKASGSDRLFLIKLAFPGSHEVSKFFFAISLFCF